MGGEGPCGMRRETGRMVDRPLGTGCGTYIVYIVGAAVCVALLLLGRQFVAKGKKVALIKVKKLSVGGFGTGQGGLVRAMGTATMAHAAPGSDACPQCWQRPCVAAACRAAGDADTDNKPSRHALVRFKPLCLCAQAYPPPFFWVGHIPRQTASRRRGRSPIAVKRERRGGGKQRIRSWGGGG